MSSLSSSERDRSSLSNPHEVKVTHLDWNVTVDFEKRVFRAKATYLFDRLTDADHLDLDTAHLLVHSVNDQEGNHLEFTIGSVTKPHLGQKLSISLPNSATEVTIHYETTHNSSAIQWLPPAQTAGKVHSYLFTQCQAIHARSMVPCQDTPGVKMTYSAVVRVPEWATVVMSALFKFQEMSQLDATRVCSFQQKVPISSYLLAMAVGNLGKRDLSKRCAIWSEPSLVDAAAFEFAQTEEFLRIAEEIAGTPYRWGRYDLLCLPPSFPYGGMENPCLTFVTPTLLAGDRSLADVVAHEIAHSWTGNLVTNATWDHFWLNEGWTTWFQRKIMARIHNNDKFLDFDAIGGYKALQDTVNSQMPPEYTKLVLPIGDSDPDDAYSTVAYEKGFNLLISLERRVGSDAFEHFFQSYIATFQNKTLTSEDFRNFFMGRFESNDAVKDIDWDEWLYGVGMPPETVIFDRSLAEASANLAAQWFAVDRYGRMLPTESIQSWSSAQITCFLDELQILVGTEPLQVSTLHAMDKQCRFLSSKNSEILFRYCQLAVSAEDETILPVVVRFLTSQGRMKFVRPLYRALYQSEMGRQLAVSTFLEHKTFYHPICVKMIASDLYQQPKGRSVMKVCGYIALTAVLAGASFIWIRRRKG